MISQPQQPHHSTRTDSGHTREVMLSYMALAAPSKARSYSGLSALLKARSTPSNTISTSECPLWYNELNEYGGIKDETVSFHSAFCLTHRYSQSIMGRPGIYLNRSSDQIRGYIIFWGRRNPYSYDSYRSTFYSPRSSGTR